MAGYVMKSLVFIFLFLINISLDECYQTITDDFYATSATIISENYPSKYPMKKNFRYYIHTSSSQTTRIVIKDLNLATCTDAFQIFRGHSTASSNLVTKKCTATADFIVDVVGPATIYLTTYQSSPSARGFKVDYNMFTAAAPASTTVTTTTNAAVASTTVTTTTNAAVASTTVPTTTNFALASTTVPTTTNAVAASTTVWTTTNAEPTSVPTTIDPSTTATTTSQPLITTEASSTETLASTTQPTTKQSTNETPPSTTLPATEYITTETQESTTLPTTEDITTAIQEFTTLSTTEDITTATQESITTSTDNFQILCSNNCRSQVKVSNSMTIRSKCINNCGSTNYQYAWTLTRQLNVLYNNLENIIYQANPSSLLLKPFSLIGGEQHTLRLQVKSEGTTVATTTYTFTTNTPPTGAVCSVSPLQGNALEKVFTVTCDSSNVISNGQLYFQYTARPKGLDRIPVIIHSGYSSISSQVQLPLGNQENGYITEINLKITDSIGDYYEITEEVVVLPSNASASEQLSQLKDSLTKSLDEITNLVDVAMILQSMEKVDDPEAVQTMTEARQMLAEGLDYLAFNSTEQLQKHIAVLDVITEDVTQVNAKAQVASVNALSKMTSYVADKNLTHDEIKNFVSDLLVQTNQFYAISNHSATDPQLNNNQRIKEILDKAMKIQDDLIHTGMSGVEVGDPGLVAKSAKTSLQVLKTSAAKLNGAQLLMGDNMLTIEASSTASGCVQVQTGINLINPYMWENSSSSVDSAIVDTNVVLCQSSNRKRRASPTVGYNGVKATVKINNPPPAHKVHIQYNSSDMVYHFMNLSAIHKPVMVSVFPTTGESLTVYFGYDDNINKTNFIDKFQIPNPSLIGYEEQHTFMVSTNILQTHSASQLHIGVVREDCSNSSKCVDSNTLTYSYKIAEISCSHWDDGLQKWTIISCQVGPESTPSKVKFKSNLLGSLGAGMFVGPNTINFKTVFSGFAGKLVDNIAVVTTIVIIMLTYVVMVIICRKYDKKDQNKWKLLSLADNNENDEHCYEIHVYTGNKSNGGTDSNVHLVIAGTEGDSGVRWLHDGKRKNFQTGDFNSFLLRCPHSLGIPVTLKVWHDNTGKGKMADWYLSKIVIVDIQTHNWYLFVNDKWLSYDKGSGKTDCVLHLISSDDAMTGSDLLSNNTKMFTSDHIWLSVGYRKTRSFFTRVQRLSCCLATLMLTMVASAMWYGTETKAEPQSSINIGSVSISIHQIYTSIMCGLIVAPPVIIVLFLYEKSAPKPIKKHNYKHYGVLEGKIIGDRKKSKKFPYWCVYIAHILVVLSVVLGTFFTILYAFEWGREKSEEWLGGLLMSVIESIILIQPVKVFIVIMIYSLLFKMDADTCDLEETLGKMVTRSDDMKSLMQVEDKEKVPKKVAKALKKKKELDAKMRVFFFEVLWGVIFIALILWTVMGNQDRNVFLQNNNLEKIFTSEIVEGETRDGVWEWLHGTVLSGLYVADSNNKELYPVYGDKVLSDMNSILIGLPAIRQIRVIDEKCKMVDSIKPYIEQCSQSLEDKWMDTSNYQINWKQNTNHQIHTSNLSITEEAFIHKTADELKSVSFWGNLQVYPGSGYVARLQDNFLQSNSTLNQLQTLNWIDKYTRVIFIEFTTLNPNTNLFSFVKLCLELPMTGGLFNKTEIQSIQLYRYVGAGGLLNILVEALTLLMALVIIIIEVLKIKNGPRKYVKSFWNKITILGLLTFLSAVGMYAARCIYTVYSLEDVMNNPNSTSSFSQVAKLHLIFITLLGISAFLLELRLLYALRYIKMISTLGETLAQSRTMLLSVGMKFSLMFMSFGSLFSIMYGSTVEEYRSFQTAISSLTVIAFDFRGFEKYVASTGRFGVAALIVYAVIVMTITINLFVSVLNDFVSKVRRDKDANKDHEVIDYMIDMFLRVIPGYKTRDKDDSKEWKLKRCERLSGRESRTGDLVERVDNIDSVIDGYHNNQMTQAVEALLVDYYDWFNNSPKCKQMKVKGMDEGKNSSLNVDKIFSYSLMRNKPSTSTHWN